MGQETYDNKIIELLNKLPDPEQVCIGRGDENNDDEVDEDNNLLPA